MCTLHDVVNMKYLVFWVQKKEKLDKFRRFEICIVHVARSAHLSFLLILEYIWISALKIYTSIE